ncbi:MAG: ribosomal protein S18-alanine N-acetyltransferase [Clostridiales bacterium]|nr:ribosomal protein S18-alanine N-acetyltransferase [Clostridiales bacterium]
MTLRCLTDDSLLDGMMAVEQSSFASPWSREDVKSTLTSPWLRVIGAFEGEELVGWGCVGVNPPEARLMTVAILPGSRRKGHGRQLLRALLQAAADAGCGYMELECRRSNLPAQRMYTTNGFIKVGVSKGYYTDTGEDAFIYCLPALPEGHPENDPYITEN